MNEILWGDESFEELECLANSYLGEPSAYHNVVISVDVIGYERKPFMIFEVAEDIFCYRIRTIRNPITGRFICYDAYEPPPHICELCGGVAPYYMSSEWAHTSIDGRRVEYCNLCVDSGIAFVECKDCGEVVQIKYARIVNDGDGYYVCPSCSSGYEECCECGRLTNDYDFDCRRRIVCTQCLGSDNYTFCDDCGDHVRVTDIELRGDDRLCPNCIERLDESLGRIYDYHEFSRSEYTPRGGDDGDTLFMGVELEVDDGDFTNVSYEDRWGDLIHFERDGSLSDNGVECITQPCTLKYHMQNLNWEGLCAELRDAGFKSHNTRTCGLHVHLSRAALTPSLIVKLDVFINRNGRFFSDIGRRINFYGHGSDDDGGFNHYKKAMAGKGLTEYDFYDGNNKTARKIYDRCGCFWAESRYQAVNTNPKKTVELRFMRGTLNHETILGTLEVIHGLTRYLKTISWKELYVSSNIEGFIKFLYEERKKYPHVMPLIERLDGKKSGETHEEFIKNLKKKGK